MKAEHRKELQTNALADFLGRTVRNVRGGGTGIPWFWVVLVLIVVLGVFGFLWVQKNRARANAEAWVLVERNDEVSLDELTKDSKDSKQSQAARFIHGFNFLWDTIRYLGTGEPENMKKRLLAVAGYFEKLADECKEDPNLAAEAKYHMAVATESLAAFDTSNSKTEFKSLEIAKRLFTELAQGDLAATAYGKLGKKRLDQYNNANEYVGIVVFYAEFQNQARYRDRGIPGIGGGQ